MSLSADFKSSWTASPAQFRKELRWSCTFTHILSIICSTPWEGQQAPKAAQPIFREKKTRNEWGQKHLLTRTFQKVAFGQLLIYLFISAAFGNINSNKSSGTSVLFPALGNAARRTKVCTSGWFRISWLLCDISLDNNSPSLISIKYPLWQTQCQVLRKQRNGLCNLAAAEMTTRWCPQPVGLSITES